MPLFFSRRAYNAQTKKFTNNRSTITRYVALEAQAPGGGGWTGGIIDQGDWLQKVKDAGAANGVLVFVHGFNTAQADMLRRLDKIEKGLRAEGFAGAVVAFDWPSDGSVLNYNSDKTDAKHVAPSLVLDALVPIMEMSGRPKTSLLAHSMGAYLTLRAFSDFGDSAMSVSGAWKLDQVCFASADADAAWLEKGAWGALVLRHRARRFTNYYSGRDGVLELSKGINGGRKRLGRSGMPQLVTSGQFDVYCNEQYLRDVPDADQTMRYSHTWWFDNPGFYDDLNRTLRGDDAQVMPTRRATNQPPDQALLT